MKNLALFILLVLLAVAILLFIYNPQVLENVWLWIVGLIGPIIAGFKRIVEYFSPSDEKTDQKSTPKSTSKPLDISDERTYQTKFIEMQEKINRLELELQQSGMEKDDFDGETLILLRYFDDNETTLGLLFFEGKFFSYVLEDTYREVKVPGKTRIPKGTYNVDFNRADTPLTLKYRKKGDWFSYHIHIKDVPNFSGIYIHIGNYNTDTEGCLLIAKGISHSDSRRMIVDSTNAYMEFYDKISNLLNNGTRIRIKIFDEDWIQNSNLAKLTA